MNCKVCSSKTVFFRKAIILNKYNIDYFKCDNCEFIQTEDPCWLEEAYREPINVSDTGIIARNIYLTNITASIIYFLFDKKASFLDYAGGYGLLTRMMRDIGFDFYWHDPYTKNLFARGFEYAGSGAIELITSFESFEHFVNPSQEIEKMFAISENLLFSTELIQKSEYEDWWYYGSEHGQHISFYSMKTLSFLSSKYGLNLYSDGKSLHLLTAKKISSSLFKLLRRLNGIGCFYVRRTMKSKTFDDHEASKRRLFYQK